MPTAIHAIYENGVFRPVQPVDLPERCEVEVDIRAVSGESPDVNFDTAHGVRDRRHLPHKQGMTARSNFENSGFPRCVSILSPNLPPNLPLNLAFAKRKMQA